MSSARVWARSCVIVSEYRNVFRWKRPLEIFMNLTTQANAEPTSRVASSDASAPGNEIEVTEEMSLAGIAALPCLPSEMLGTLEEGSLVSAVYRAMRKYAPEGLPQSQGTS